jgi:hypothetical protein
MVVLLACTTEQRRTTGCCRSSVRHSIMFELTELTRKDKYIMLADNKDVVPRTPNKF